MARSKVKSRSHHNVAYLKPLSNAPTKYQLPTLYGLRDIAWITFFTLKVTRARSNVKSRSNQDAPAHRDPHPLARMPPPPPSGCHPGKNLVVVASTQLTLYLGM